MPQPLKIPCVALTACILIGCQPGDDAVAPGPMETAATDAAGGKLVLVAGATGRTGRRIVAQLLDRGYRVRVFVRDEAKARQRLGDDLQYVIGDVREPETLPAAVEGVEAVVSAIGSSGRAQDPSNSPEAVDYNGVKNLVDAAAAAGVSRFVLVSAMGVTMEEHPLNQLFDDVLKWKLKGEQHLRASRLPYTVIRPGGLTEDPGGEHGVTVTAEDLGDGFIPRADVATTCVEALQHEEAVNKTFSVLSDTKPPQDDWVARFAAIPRD